LSAVAAIVLAEAALKIYEAIEDPNAGKVRKGLEEWRGDSQRRGAEGTEGTEGRSKRWWEFWK
jgi:hypothetical protein